MVHSMYLEPEKYYAKYNPTEGCDNPKSDKERKFAEAVAAGIDPETAYRANYTVSANKSVDKEVDERMNRLKHYIDCLKQGFSGNLPSPSDHLKVLSIVNSLKEANPIERIIGNLRVLRNKENIEFKRLNETMFLKTYDYKHADLKGRVDILLYNELGDYSIIDLKCTSGLGVKDFMEICDKFEYQRELSFYSNLVEGFVTEDGITLENNIRNYIIAVDSDSPYGVQIYSGDPTNIFKFDVDTIHGYLLATPGEGRLGWEMMPQKLLS